MENIIILVILAGILGSIVWYLRKAKSAEKPASAALTQSSAEVSAAVGALAGKQREINYIIEATADNRRSPQTVY